MADYTTLLDYFTDSNFLIGCIFTFIVGCVGSGILLMIIKRNPNLTHKFNILVGESGSNWYIAAHIIIGGIIPLVISFGHLANPIERSPISLAEGAAWPAIFLSLVESKMIIQTSEELKRIKEIGISTKRKGNGESEGK